MLELKHWIEQQCCFEAMLGDDWSVHGLTVN